MFKVLFLCAYTQYAYTQRRFRLFISLLLFIFFTTTAILFFRSFVRLHVYKRLLLYIYDCFPFTFFSAVVADGGGGGGGAVLLQ